MDTYVSMEDVLAVIQSVSANDNSFAAMSDEILVKVRALSQNAPTKGHWKEHYKQVWIYAECSECGAVHNVGTKFCPDCGVEMESTDLRKTEPPKILFNGVSGGVPALIGKEDLIFSEERSAESATQLGTAFVRPGNIEGFYTCGIEQARDMAEHKAGYIWASSAGAINKELNTKLVDVLYKRDGAGYYKCCAVDADVLNSILAYSDYHVVMDPRVTDRSVEYDVKWGK